MKLVLGLFCKTSFPLPLLLALHGEKYLGDSYKILFIPLQTSAEGSFCLLSVTFNSHLTVRLARSESAQCNMSLLRFLVALVCVGQALLEICIHLSL